MTKTLALGALTLAAALAFTSLASRPAEAQGTTFTYQGQLNVAGSPANGLHDLVFRLYDAALGGAQVGSTICVDDVTLVDGVFTVQLDFGQQFATTAQRHLEIEVRADTGLGCGDGTGFTVLAPRQQLTAAPMASHANAAFSLDAADGSPASAVFVDNDGKVGVGTTAPATQVHVKGAVPIMILQDTASPSNQAGYVTFWNNASVETAWLGYGTIGSPQLSLVNARTGGDLRLYTGSGGDINFTPGSGGDINLVPAAGGRVGVGTYTPAATLDVRGDIRLGPTGQYFAPSSEENLRIVRGRVSSLGSIVAGAGFTVSRTSAGVFFIDFVPDFPSVPAVTVTVDYTNDGAFVGMTNGLTANTTGIRITTGGGTLSDRTFNFTAIGPR
ncbi:MAG: hypothetical protein FD129_1241 [bacterium]|nr:MAG: hypothetical protein FD129_1241 [bacterium]